MPTYQYEAMDHTGREVKDSIDAATQEEAQQLIRQKGFFVTKIAEKAKKTRKAAAKKGGRRKKKSFTIGKISTKQLCTFTRQLSTLQDAGLPILRSLKILEGQCKPGVLKNALGDVVEDIESGQTLSEAFSKHPKAFDRLYCNMIKAGEAGGALEAILQRLADFKEKSQSLKRKIKGAMVYPIVVILVACIDRGLHPLLHHPQVRGDLQRLRRALAAHDGHADRVQPLPDQVLLHRLPDTLLDLDFHQVVISEQDGGVCLRPDLADDSGHGRPSPRNRRWRGPCARWARWCSRACRFSNR